MKLKQLASNMTELQLDDGTRVLFSYETPVAAFKEKGFTSEQGVYSGMKMSYWNTIKTDKKWSVTTSKHINKWLSMIDQQGFGDTSAILVDQSVLDRLIEEK